MSRETPKPATRPLHEPLRSAAETQLADHPAQIVDGPESGLLHELQVHRIELEMQNEALRQTQAKLETSHDRYVELYEFAPVAYLTLSRAGLIDQANLTCATLLGKARQSLLRRRFNDFVVPEDGDLWHRHFIQVVKDGDNASFELLLQRGNGTRFHARLECRLDYRSDGEESQVRVTFSDISERRAAELALQLDHKQQSILREMLEETVKRGALEETLASCLTRLLTVSWLMLEPRGGIFTLAENGQDLLLAASHNLSAEIAALCARVPLACYHSGHAATSREMQSSPCVNERHEIRFPIMADHDHINLTLASEGEVLGVLVLYLAPGFKRDPAREQFLGSVCDILAGFIRRKQVEASWKRLNEGLEERVQLRTVELQAAKLEAERANQAKSEFLSRMSHELRTPLNAILGFGQLLQRASLPELQADNAGEILHAGRHLLELINEVLDLARIESGKLNLSLEPVTLADIVQECVSQAQPLADARGIELILQDVCGGHGVRADHTRLKQVLLNLLSNAIKYNREQGAVSIACVADADDDVVQIRISDTGAGLTATQRERHFIAFDRLGAEQSGIEGTGIGLVLSQRLVALMGGEIGVESTPGSGSTFWVKLPLVADFDNGLAAAAAVTQAEAVSACVHSRQFDLLCIEDNPTNLCLIERILAERPDLRLLSANVPSLGLELALTHQPELILLDINLPEMDGFEVMWHLRENPATRDIPVLAISANAMPDDLIRGKAAGFVDYLTKPLDVSVFLAAVDAALGKSHV